MSVRFKRIITAGCLPVITAIIGSTSLAADNYDELRAAMQSLAPGAANITIGETPIEGLLEVQIDSEIVYTNRDGKILMQGRMFDIETSTDLTERSKSRLRQPRIKDIDRSEQIVFAPENVDHELIVFTDIDCPYCVRMHNQMTEYNRLGIRIRYLAFPRAGVSSSSFDKTKMVCAASESI